MTVGASIETDRAASFDLRRPKGALLDLGTAEVTRGELITSIHLCQFFYACVNVYMILVFDLPDHVILLFWMPNSKSRAGSIGGPD